MSMAARAVLQDPRIKEKLDELQEKLVCRAERLAGRLGQREDKERQLRNILAIAEQGSSWTLVQLFIRYQAARKQLDQEWAEGAIAVLQELGAVAQSIAQDAGLTDRAGELHLELVRRVLGYTIWWHAWNARRQSSRGEGGR